MWPFKKKTELKSNIEIKLNLPKVKRNVLKYREEKINIGKTTINITLSDKRKFQTVIYGHANQHTGGGGISLYSNQYEEPVCSPVEVTNSERMAQLYIRNIGADPFNIVDDDKNPKESVIGIVKSAKIVKTVDYEEEYRVGYIEQEIVDGN